VKSNRIRLLAACAVALALLTAACGDDSDDTTKSGDTTTTAAGASDAAQATFSFVPLDAGGPNTKAALQKGDIDIALLFSSDGAIAANKWVALDDDQHLQPVDNFIPAVRTASNTPEIDAALNAVQKALTVDAMQHMVASVSIDGENPADVAKAFLEDLTIPKGATGNLTIGSANFAESEITAELYAQALASSGAKVSKKLQFGAREAYIPALEQGQLDVVPEFVGTLAFFFDANAKVTSNLDESVALSRSLASAKGITLLDPSTADSVNTFVVTKATADKYHLSKVSDLKKVGDALKLGGPPECPERVPCLKGLESVYGLKFKS
jgi:osmoprotectant transport system substrate-binding protein